MSMVMIHVICVHHTDILDRYVSICHLKTGQKQCKASVSFLQKQLQIFNDQSVELLYF